MWTVTIAMVLHMKSVRPFNGAHQSFKRSPCNQKTSLTGSSEISLKSLVGAWWVSTAGLRPQLF
uniref:Uncharacterized protein n=1 Tax=Anguilla anguilla TaxID=7936 RepID=A0A0E9SPA5_ANGAN